MIKIVLSLWIRNLSLCFALLSGKSLQSCPTLCDPVDCSLPGSAVHWILQARILNCVVMQLMQVIFQTQESKLRLLHLLLWQIGPYH